MWILIVDQRGIPIALKNTPKRTGLRKLSDRKVIGESSMRSVPIIIIGASITTGLITTDLSIKSNIQITKRRTLKAAIMPSTDLNFVKERRCFT